MIDEDTSYTSIENADSNGAENTANDGPGNMMMMDGDGDGNNSNDNNGGVENGVESSNISVGVGSSIVGAIFNFTNCIIGAGAIGLGGAIANSGGAISVFFIVFFGVLTKFSLDLVIQLSVNSSYEELGRKTFGTSGWTAVLLSKWLYSFGCLVAYVVVVKDNFASALGNLISQHIDQDILTIMVSIIVILPLCLLRDMTPLSRLSLISVVSMGMIVAIVIAIYFQKPEIREQGGTFYEHWFQVHEGVVESLGTFVFTYVSQHTVHLTFRSLKPELQTLNNWKTVSSYSIGSATIVSLVIGVFVYMTFWEKTQSDLFDMYPPSLKLIDVAKVLLCITMLLTFPLPFFACREMMIVAALVTKRADIGFQLTSDEESDDENRNNLAAPLLMAPQTSSDSDDDAQEPVTTTQGDTSRDSTLPVWCISERQLALPYHIGITFLLWGTTIFLAIVAPNLGDVLNIVGCATGTVIAFILPALFSLKLKGYTHLAGFLLIVGVIVGGLGTFFSVKKLIGDSIEAVALS